MCWYSFPIPMNNVHIYMGRNVSFLNFVRTLLNLTNPLTPAAARPSWRLQSPYWESCKPLLLLLANWMPPNCLQFNIHWYSHRIYQGIIITPVMVDNGGYFKPHTDWHVHHHTTLHCRHHTSWHTTPHRLACPVDIVHHHTAETTTIG